MFFYLNCYNNDIIVYLDIFINAKKFSFYNIIKTEGVERANEVLKSSFTKKKLIKLLKTCI